VGSDGQGFGRGEIESSSLQTGLTGDRPTCTRGILISPLCASLELKQNRKCMRRSPHDVGDEKSPLGLVTSHTTWYIRERETKDQFFVGYVRISFFFPLSYAIDILFLIISRPVRIPSVSGYCSTPGHWVSNIIIAVRTSLHVMANYNSTGGMHMQRQNLLMLIRLFSIYIDWMKLIRIERNFNLLGIETPQALFGRPGLKPSQEPNQPKIEWILGCHLFRVGSPLSA
jgi:hypothetical protein